MGATIQLYKTIASDAKQLMRDAFGLPALGRFFRPGNDLHHQTAASELYGQSAAPTAGLVHAIVLPGLEFTMESQVTFDDTVKQLKAVEWLLANDVQVRAAAELAMSSPSSAIIVAGAHGELIQRKLTEVSQRMEVTDQERREGYPLPKDDDERTRLALMRVRAAQSNQPDSVPPESDP